MTINTWRSNWIAFLIFKNMENYRYEVARQVNALNNGNIFGQIPSVITEIDKSVCWAWDNWDDEIIATYYCGDKPKYPTESFINEWVQNEDFEADGFDVDFLKEL